MQEFEILNLKAQRQAREKTRAAQRAGISIKQRRKRRIGQREATGNRIHWQYENNSAYWIEHL